MLREEELNVSPEQMNQLLRDKKDGGTREFSFI